MKTLKPGLFAWASVGCVIVALSACNRSTEIDPADAGQVTPAALSMDGTSNSGCCGKCQTAAETDDSVKGCCGNCQGKPGTAMANVSGCCGKCDGETAETTQASTSGCCGKCGEGKSENAKVEKRGPCGNDCNACAEGNPENCRCETTPDSQVQTVSTGNSNHEDRDIFHYLLRNHEKITRTVEELENGVRTVTESSEPEIVGKIQEHVASMHQRIEKRRPLRMWDELYQEIFKNTDKIKMEISETDSGVSVTETSDDPYVVELIKAHAKVVTGFTKRGFEEARENHEPPKR